MGPMRKKINRVFSVVVIGDKDHGKSTLIGRLAYETGAVQLDTVKRLRETSRIAGGGVEWAHVLDSFHEEREGEMTLDTTRIVLEYKHNHIELIDVPGHQQLWKNMLSGSSVAQCALLVVAADSGLTPQAMRHIEIVKALGIKSVIVVINKCDLIGYSRVTYTVVASRVKETLKKMQCTVVSMLPASGREGHNITRASKRLAWFKGATVMGALENACAVNLKGNVRFVALVQHVFPNAFVGRVESGCLYASDFLQDQNGVLMGGIKKLMSCNRAVSCVAEGAVFEVLLHNPHPGLERGSMFTSKKNRARFGASARCAYLFFSKPTRKKLVYSTALREIEILNINPDTSTYMCYEDRMTFAGNVYPGEKFAIKNRDHVIGIGTVLEIV